MTNSFAKARLIMGLIGSVLLFVAFSYAYADTSNAPERVIVFFEDGVYQTAKEQQALVAQVAGRDVLPLEFLHAVAMEIPEHAARKILEHKPGVEAVYTDVEMSLLKKPVKVPPSVPEQVTDWGVDTIDADLVWGSHTGAATKVAVLDTGIDADHPDLADNVKDGASFVLGESWYNDGNGHGTHVSGTIAAINNNIGVVGVAPGASLYGVQVLNKSGSGTLSYLLAGLQWSIVNDMDVVTMSLGFPITTTIDSLGGLAAALDAVNDAGIVVVAAAGNNSADAVSYPAAYPTVIAVAATNADNSLAYYSNYGEGVDVAAPGTGITSTWKDGTYNTISGTSMATPHITGVVALLLGADSTLTDENGNGRINDEVFARIQAGATVAIPGSYSFARIYVPDVPGL